MVATNLKGPEQAQLMPVPGTDVDYKNVFLSIHCSDVIIVIDWINDLSNLSRLITTICTKRALPNAVQPNNIISQFRRQN